MKFIGVIFCIGGVVMIVIGSFGIGLLFTAGGIFSIASTVWAERYTRRRQIAEMRQAGRRPRRPLKRARRKAE